MNLFQKGISIGALLFSLLSCGSDIAGGGKHEPDAGQNDAAIVDVYIPDAKVELPDAAPEPLHPCEALVPGHNGSLDDRINIVFAGIGYDSVEEAKAIALKFVDYEGVGEEYEVWAGDANRSDNIMHGLLGIEPFKSNKDLMNFWFSEYAYAFEEDAYTGGEIDAWCANRLGDESFFVRFYNRTWMSPAGYGGRYPRIMFTMNDDGTFCNTVIGLINHELGGHGIGILRDVAYPTLYDFSDPPNCAATIQEAQQWWGDLVGDGCGADGVVDCSEHCFSDGTCGGGDYETEVGYFTVEPEDCFENGQPIDGCSYTLNRSWFPQGGGDVIRKKIGLRAMTEAECGMSQDNCAYESGGQVYCHDKEIDRNDLCSSLIDLSIYPQAGDYWHMASHGCTYRPHLMSIMFSADREHYGLANERSICERFVELTGRAGGHCTTEFGIE